MQLSTKLAQGRYYYSCDGREMPVQDSWQLGEGDQGQRLLISQRLVGAAGYGMQVRAILSAGLVSDCQMSWRDQVAEVSAHYSVKARGAEPRVGDAIEAQWRGPNGPQRALVEGGNRLLFPLMRIFMGPLLRKLEQFRGGLDVVTPDIVDPSQRGKLLAPRISHRQARPMPRDAASRSTEEMGGDISAFIYQGDDAERDANCYVDSRGLLVGYDWPSSTGRLWQVRLRDLEWSPQLDALA
ncbi:hypothetical protein [Microbulbifer discodermiae]|uniref:hypothetical protein n=1 Tax=Microbulbifer sp. 2201CG32-9 TaxID=3232309 RepID=UPI00345C5DBB